MKQLAFPGLQLPTVGDGSDPVPDQGAPETAPIHDERQLGLFADKVALERDMAHALHSGEFAEARRLRDVHRETYGRAPATARLGFLDTLAGFAPSSSPDLALRAWEDVDQALQDEPALRRGVREGVLRQLLACHSPAALVEARPSCLGVLATFLTSEARAAGGAISPEARRLVRDALLTGHAIEAGDVVGDSQLADLIAEHLPPRWLACAGAVRRLWPVPALTAGELHRFDETDAPGTAADDASRFWLCLRVAETPGCPERLLHEARRRMKALSADLHATYMRRAPTGTAARS